MHFVRLRLPLVATSGAAGTRHRARAVEFCCIDHDAGPRDSLEDWSLTYGIAVSDLAYCMILWWPEQSRRRCELPVLINWHESVVDLLGAAWTFAALRSEARA